MRSNTLLGGLGAMTELLEGMTFDPAAMRAATNGFLVATDVAEHAVSRGMAFREAHELVGRIVANLERSGRTFEDVTPAEWVAWSPLLDGMADLLDPDVSVARRTTPGGTSGPSVRLQIEAVRARVGELRGREARARSVSTAP